MSVDLDERDARLATAAGAVAPAETTIARLVHADSSLAVSIPVRRDDGQVEVLQGYRVRWDDTRGPGKGGVRFHPSVTREEVEELSLAMTIKTALLDLPYGGAKGGVAVDAKHRSAAEVERIARGWVQRVADVIGPDLDVPAPDMYTNERIMAWMADEWGKLVRRHEPAAFTGKPLAVGGSPGRATATADGAKFVLDALAGKLDLTGHEPTVAIQGFGNAGAELAQLLFDAGYRVVAVSDSQGAIHAAQGLHIPSVRHVKDEQHKLAAVYCDGSVCDLAEHERLGNDELLGLDVDVLVPAALGGVLTGATAADVRARVVLEVANAPTTAAADRVLDDRGVTVVPDVLANAGGVTVSYFEWVQNRAGWRWSAAEVRERLAERMRTAAEESWATAQETGLPLRAAAHAVALRRLDAAARARDSLE